MPIRRSKYASHQDYIAAMRLESSTRYHAERAEVRALTQVATDREQRRKARAEQSKLKAEQLRQEIAQITGLRA